MTYTSITLHRDLLALNVSAWDWAGATPGAFRADDLSRYCWRAYESSYRSVGDLVIGRVQHLTAAGLYSKVADILGKDGTLFDAGAHGNLLKMDKWARVMNDSWILGGVHRGARFRLASPRVLENLWNAAAGFLVVTARELIGLLHFGYTLEQIGPFTVLVQRDPASAVEATLVAYDNLAKTHGSLRAAIDLIDKGSPHARLMEEIRSRRR